MQVAKAVIGLVVVGHYPLNHHPARLAWEDLERQWLGYEEFSFTFSTIQSIIFIWTTVAVSVVVSSLFIISTLSGIVLSVNRSNTHITAKEVQDWKILELAISVSSLRLELSTFLKMIPMVSEAAETNSQVLTEVSVKHKFECQVENVRSRIWPNTQCLDFWFSFEWTVWLTAMPYRILKVHHHKNTNQPRKRDEERLQA